ncbi:MAG: dihydroorotate dehydrogenase [Candidatus Omnitrophica bacterium]|nr:dihydroorotate dehydrogenase [Candidatus Omnitrophota bacterium]
MTPDLTTKIKHLEFRNPVAVASGTFGTKDEYASYMDYEQLGAIITKTITVQPRQGNPMPRVCETVGGMLNAIGLQNKGLEDFLEDKIPYFEKIRTPLIVNIAGESLDDFRILAETLDGYKNVVKAIEINLSCPNVEVGGATFMRKKERILSVVKTVRQETDLITFAKLSPELGDLNEIAGLLIREGVDGLSLINTLKGMAVDIEKRCFRLANKTGGLSGPAIRPVALRYVYEIKKAYKIPVIASGGIMTASDALEYLLVGADLVAVGTANFIDPHATGNILCGILDYCRRYRIARLDDLRGTLIDIDQ